MISREVQKTNSQSGPEEFSVKPMKEQRKQDIQIKIRRKIQKCPF